MHNKPGCSAAREATLIYIIPAVFLGTRLSWSKVRCPSGQTKRKLGRCGLNFAELGPDLIELGPRLGDTSQMRPLSGQTWSTFSKCGRDLPNANRVGPQFG